MGKEFLAKYSRDYHQANRDRLNLLERERRQKPIRQFQQRKYRQLRTLAKAEYDRKRYLENSEAIKRRTSIYAKNHPEKLLAASQKRRALIKKAQVNLQGIKRFLAAVRAKAIVPCYYCGKSLARGMRHFDHIVSLARGGSHSADNLCVACASCNCSKQDKPIQTWVRIGQQILGL